MSAVDDHVAAMLDLHPDHLTGAAGVKGSRRCGTSLIVVALGLAPMLAISSATPCAMMGLNAERSGRSPAQESDAGPHAQTTRTRWNRSSRAFPLITAPTLSKPVEQPLGLVLLRCRSELSVRCRVLDETPAHLGLARQALELESKIQRQRRASERAAAVDVRYDFICPLHELDAADPLELSTRSGRQLRQDDLRRSACEAD